MLARRPEQNPVAADHLVDGHMLWGIEVGQARGVGLHAPDRRLGRVPGGGVEFGPDEIIVHRAIQVELLPLMKNHERGGCKDLGDRGGVVHRVLGRRDAILPIRPAEPFFPQHFAFPGYRNRDRGEGG
jgi:hypothetical protein